jgi:hypothetical protein
LFLRRFQSGGLSLLTFTFSGLLPCTLCLLGQCLLSLSLGLLLFGPSSFLPRSLGSLLFCKPSRFLHCFGFGSCYGFDPLLLGRFLACILLLSRMCLLAFLISLRLLLLLGL